MQNKIDLSSFASAHPDAAALLPVGEVFGECVILHDMPHENASYMEFRVIKKSDSVITPDGSVQLYEHWHDSIHASVKNPYEAAPFIQGTIKWDGCANMDFPECRDGALLFCGYNEAVEVGQLMGRMYELCREHLANFDAELADMPSLNALPTL